VTLPRRTLFVLTILTGSFLLFLVQPMIARMALPRLGGAPAVWNSAMLVYQALLLGGYAYAHALGRLAPRRQAMVQVGLLVVAALWLPIGLADWTPTPDAEPALWAPTLLLASIGPLFLAVSAQAPLIQRWFAVASDGEDPYRLYAASNLGSFGGLLAYPLVVEPLLTLGGQSRLWTAGYVVFALLLGACGLMLPRGGPARTEATTPGVRVDRRQVLRWVLLAFVPSGLMLATSTYISTDIVAMPLLWVVPLGLYLLTFTVAFAANRWLADLITHIAPVTILLFGGIMLAGYTEMPYFNAGVALVLLFIAAVALHAQMYRERPAPEQLTGFYLAMSAGGALGGVFTALIAPVVFDWTWEYPLLILAAGALAPQLYLTEGLKRIWTDPPRRLIALGLLCGAIAVLAVLRARGVVGVERQGMIFVAFAAAGVFTLGARVPYMVMLVAALTLFGGYRSIALTAAGDRVRSYFGVYTVTDQPEQRVLAHGTTVHGIQFTGSPARERMPTTYYAPKSGVGLAMQAAPFLYGPAARIGVVGLGTGTLACYAKPGQHWRIYEIDPAVVRLSRDSGRFTFLKNCLPDARIVLGDARLRIAADVPGSLDLLALDAFSSDAVPMHLLTREAFAAYGRVLAPDGVLLVHISNRFLDLKPVIAAEARVGGWHAAVMDYRPSVAEGGASASLWIALSRRPAPIRLLRKVDPSWEPLADDLAFAPWTDDHATILPLLKPPRMF
jgi:SAM-dependent methyltransferase